MDENEKQLEELIDDVGLAEVLALIVSICHGKAEHLRINWQDETSARVYERFARRIDKVRDYVGAYGL